MRALITRYRWPLLAGVTVVVVALGAWMLLNDTPLIRFIGRLYHDKHFLKRTLAEWGMLAPVLFIVLQALQVVVSPIPGEATGFLGGFLFGEWLGFIYSSIGLTAGSVAAFAVGRWLGAHFVQRLVSKETWERLGFIVEAEGAILCFIVYLIPGLPKDIVCYLFGISPMPLWVFAVVSCFGRMPGTYILSAQGARTQAGAYIEAVAITAVAIAVALPLYYYRHRIVAWVRGRRAGGPDARPVDPGARPGKAGTGSDRRP